MWETFTPISVCPQCASENLGAETNFRDLELIPIGYVCSVCGCEYTVGWTSEYTVQKDGDRKGGA